MFAVWSLLGEYEYIGLGVKTILINLGGKNHVWIYAALSPEDFKTMCTLTTLSNTLFTLLRSEVRSSQLQSS